jgi:UDP:flavonoid glycosyltransferase YjiC (YdhE family)
VPAFEDPRSDLPPSVHFIGPILPDVLQTFTPPTWWAEVLESHRPVVLVTQGTIATNPEELLLPALQGLSEADVLVVGTTGAKSAEDLGRLPDNARLAAFVPFGELMPHVDVLVTNGGYGGITIAMTHGVPVVASGISEDKAEVGNRVVTSGMGLSLKTARPTAEQIARSVKTVLTEPKFRQRARALQAECANYDAAQQGADLLEELARTQQPVLCEAHSRKLVSSPA